MALFAKKLEYWASMNSYIAILAIAKKKGGVPISFIVYRYWFCDGRAGYQMRSFFTQEEAKKALFSRLHFAETTAWLNMAGAGGGYEQIPKGIWVRVPIPRIGGRKRKKKPMQIGEIGTLYRVAKTEEGISQEKLVTVKSEIYSFLEVIGAGDQSFGCLAEKNIKLQEAEDELERAHAKLQNIRCEMEFVRSKRTGIPISPHSWGTMVMQAQS